MFRDVAKISQGRITLHVTKGMHTVIARGLIRANKSRRYLISTLDQLRLRELKGLYRILLGSLSLSVTLLRYRLLQLFTSPSVAYVGTDR